MASVLYTRKNLERQPKEVRKVKFDNRFLRSPQLLWSGTTGAVPFDYINNQIGAINTAPTQVVLPLGMGLTFGNTTTRGFIFGGKSNSAVPRYTMAAHFRPASSGTYQVLITNSSSGSNGFMMQINSAGTSVILVKPAVEAVNSLSITTGEDYFCIMGHDEGTDAYYILLRNMRTGQITSVSGTTTSAAAAPDGNYVIGNLTNSGVDRSFNGTIYSAYLAYDFIPLNSALDWINNSWAHFATNPEIFHLFSVTAYELLVDPNTYALTNSNISFYIDRLISLTANSYTLTNSNISLLLDKLLSIDSNSYLLTNSNITLLTDRLLSLNANSYALTNSDTNLLYSRNFSLDPNTFSLTNSNISLLLGKLLSVDPNTYSLTNSNVSFYSDRSLSVDPATYTLTNSNISLYSGKLLDLSPNSYTLTNSNTSLLYGRNFSLDPNSYILTLSDISYNLGKFFSIDPATYTLTTQDVSYYYNRVLSTSASSLDLILNNIAFSTSGGFVIDPATFSLTNSNIGLSIERLLSSDPNTYTLTNSNISFIADRKINIDANAYIISNQPVSLLVDKKLSVDSTNYALTNSNISFTRNYTINIGAASLALLFNDISFLSSYVFPAPSSVRYGVLYGPDGDYKTGTFLGFNTVDIASGRTVRKTTLRTSVLE